MSSLLRAPSRDGNTKVAALAAMLLAAATLACGTSKVGASRSYVEGDRLERPGAVLVYDFAFDPESVRVDAGVGGSSDGVSHQERVELGRRAVDVLAEQLVARLVADGIPAQRASAGTPVPLHAVAIQGRFDRVDEGSAARRTMVGLGVGAAHVEVHAEVYQQTASGLRKLGEGDVETGSGRKPGVIGPGAVAGATGNVAGLAVSSVMAAHSELKGAVDQEAARAAASIAERVVQRFDERGWL